MPAESWAVQLSSPPGAGTVTVIFSPPWSSVFRLLSGQLPVMAPLQEISAIGADPPVSSAVIVTDCAVVYHCDCDGPAENGLLPLSIKVDGLAEKFGLSTLTVICVGVAWVVPAAVVPAQLTTSAPFCCSSKELV